ncbi:DUF6331 family protein [Larkinella sp. C7]|jgi:hypothetical protein|uniref:DUF6331 family protein n=1 Tax=Larkinella sp. C7 TaxID=2576607 RepID=UPI0011112583|nr:DUF6331 family protein [Larkinella sp. C7]
MATLDTISIGPEKEIILLDFNYDTDSILEINECLGPFSSDITFKYSNVRDPLSEFWNKTEIACIAGCCGINAFVLWPEEIVEVVKSLDIETLVSQLERVKEQVLVSDAQIITYRRLNYNFARSSFLELMDYLLTEIKQWV